MKLKPIKIQPEVRALLSEIEASDDHLFVTGKAGTGKSTLLKLFVKTTRKNAVVLAPTGVAALNAGGQTIHSFFGFPPKLLTPSDIKKRRSRRIYEKLDILIIDEISMVRADMIDNIDLFLKKNRNDPRPFGGVRVLMFGDLFQIPPIVTSEVDKWLYHNGYETPYFFSAKSFTLNRDNNFRSILLNTVYRQDEQRFIRLLDNIRTNTLDYDDLEYLNTRYIDETELPTKELPYIRLSARNAAVEKLNLIRLNSIDSPLHMYQAKVEGEFGDRLFPTDLQLKLKRGAQVMFLKNNPEGRYVNGTIGKVIDLDFDYIAVEVVEQGKQDVIELKRHEWEISKYRLNEKNKIEGEVIGSFLQYPIKLAWAITVHKSQGKTFDRIIIDLGKGAFAPGQTYVALSRCRTLEGIILTRPLQMKDIIVDQRIVEFYEDIRFN